MRGGRGRNRGEAVAAKQEEADEREAALAQREVEVEQDEQRLKQQHQAVDDRSALRVVPMPSVLGISGPGRFDQQCASRSAPRLIGQCSRGSACVSTLLRHLQCALQSRWSPGLDFAEFCSVVGDTAPLMTVQRLSDSSLTCRMLPSQLPDNPSAADIRLKEAKERFERLEKAESLTNRNQTAEASRLQMLEDTLKTWEARHDSVAVRHSPGSRLPGGALPVGVLCTEE